MADNVTLPAVSGRVASRDVSYSGEAAQAQAVGLVVLTGADDAKVATDVTPDAPLPTQETSSPYSLLNRILAVLMSPVGYDRSLGRQRSTTVLESGTVTTVSTVTTVATVTTCTTVGGLTNVDGRNGSMLINQTNLSAWADCVRARIT